MRAAHQTFLLEFQSAEIWHLLTYDHLWQILNHKARSYQLLRFAMPQINLLVNACHHTLSLTLAEQFDLCWVDQWVIVDQIVYKGAYAVRPQIKSIEILILKWLIWHEGPPLHHQFFMPPRRDLSLIHDVAELLSFFRLQQHQWLVYFIGLLGQERLTLLKIQVKRYHLLRLQQLISRF